MEGRGGPRDAWNGLRWSTAPLSCPSGPPPPPLLPFNPVPPLLQKQLNRMGMLHKVQRAKHVFRHRGDWCWCGRGGGEGGITNNRLGEKEHTLHDCSQRIKLCRLGNTSIFRDEMVFCLISRAQMSIFVVSRFNKGNPQLMAEKHTKKKSE